MNGRWIDVVNCRLCSAPTELLTDLGELALTSMFPSRGEDAPRIPLTVRRCESCGLVQLGQNTDPSLMYRAGYGYKSGTNESMRKHLSDVVIMACDYSKPGDYVLDIGSNDGTLLKCWGWAIHKHGVDPIGDEVEGCTIERKFFTYNPARPKFKVITSLAMFYDLPDPVRFARDVAQSLSPDGVWIVEVQYAPKLLEGFWDGICHEHLTYWGLDQLATVAKQAQLTIQHVEFNAVNGGSMLAVLSKSRTVPLLEMGAQVNIVRKELDLDWNDLHDTIRFSAKNVRSALRGRRVYALGASTKGNTLLQCAFLDNQFISAAVERNEEKIGKLTPGTGIPIISEDDAWEHPPEAFLVLPYHFRESILLRYAKWRERGVKLIFPLPTVEEL